MSRAANRTLPGHHEPYAFFDRFWERISGIHERQNGPTRLNNLGVLVLNPSTLLARL